MAKLEIYDGERKVIEERELNEAVFEAETKPHLFHTVVVAQLAKRRSGTASTKTRSEVAGGGRKPWRQKGTGRARVGTASSPLWRGGGVIFGPSPRDFSKKVNKKVTREALRSALSLKLKEGDLIGVEKIEIPAPKTKEFLKFAETFELKSALIVDVKPSDNLRLGARNLSGYKVLPEKALNVLDLLSFDKLVITKEALTQIEEGLGK